MNEVVIRAENLSKKYRLGVINRKQLVDQIESWIARKMGRPDPHAFVFEKATDRMPTPRDFWALQDVSFEIKKGDVVGIMGRNGSGKSTLLKLLSRITAPTKGRAYLNGRLASLLEVGTGFNYDLTGKENVYLNGSILGLKQQEIDERYSKIVDFAEIGDFMDTPVKRYSSGMRVRLAFAVAAHLEPDILILDEVLAVGDAKFQEKCLNRIEEVKNSGVTVLFVSHSAEQVLKLCTKGILLSDGKVTAVGTVEETTHEYLQSMNLKKIDVDLVGIPESRIGMLAGRVAQLLGKNMSGGRLLFNIPIETPEGIQVIDVGWVSESRLFTLRTEPTWIAAPDICVNIVSFSRPVQQLEHEDIMLRKVGAQETWIIEGDGTIRRHRNMHGKFLIESLEENRI
jgi:ABC-type polysaccharide/polyol phosphate transport system ATPase subunit